MNQNKQHEMERLKSFAETILSFAYETGQMTTYIYEACEDLIKGCIERCSLTQMRTAVKEIKWMVEDMPMENIKALDKILMEKFGENISSKKLQNMDSILKRGKIRNDDEFVRVNEWIDHLLSDKDNPDANQQIEQYNKLLLEYQEKAARRHKKSNFKSTN